MRNERVSDLDDADETEDRGERPVGQPAAPRAVRPASARLPVRQAAAREANQAAQLHVMWARDWGMLLRTARQVAGLSLMDLAERTGLSKGYLSKLEASREGARNPSRATLVALARALPSFRPLAYTLEPTAALDTAANEAFAATPGADAARSGAPASPSLAFAAALPRPLALFLGRAEAAAARAAAGELDDSIGEGNEEAGAQAEAPIHLGWSELELLVALLALERSATAHPLTARVIARAVDRPTDSVAPLLERLTQAQVLRLAPPSRPGGAPTYAPGPALETRVGLSRIGDALTLAAALLTQGPLQQTISQSQVRPAGRPRGSASGAGGE